MPKATCSESGCRKQSYARDLCRRHYGIAYRRGTLPPKQLMLGIHSLTNIDVAVRMADCSICGPQVPIKLRDSKKGGRARCMIKIREERRRRPPGYGRRSGPRRSDASGYRRYKKYNLTQEDYDRMVTDQQGCCAICRSETSKLVVDHDHATGMVRGLLCRSCNLGIGFLGDDADVLSSAVQYLTA